MMQKIYYSPIADQEQDLEKTRDYKMQNVAASLIKIRLELSISLQRHHIYIYIYFLSLIITCFLNILSSSNKQVISYD